MLISYDFVNPFKAFSFSVIVLIFCTYFNFGVSKNLILSCTDAVGII